MRILLLCAGGLSTSLLVSKMKKYAESIGDQAVIMANPAANLEDLIEDFDIVFLGPQISHKMERIQKEFGHLNKPILVIDPVDYGMVRGKEVYEKAKKTLGQKRENI